MAKLLLLLFFLILFLLNVVCAIRYSSSQWQEIEDDIPDNWEDVPFVDDEDGCSGFLSEINPSSSDECTDPIPSKDGSRTQAPTKQTTVAPSSGNGSGQKPTPKKSSSSLPFPSSSPKEKENPPTRQIPISARPSTSSPSTSQQSKNNDHKQQTTAPTTKPIVKTKPTVAPKPIVKTKPTVAPKPIVTTSPSPSPISQKRNAGPSTTKPTVVTNPTEGNSKKGTSSPVTNSPNSGSNPPPKPKVISSTPTHSPKTDSPTSKKGSQTNSPSSSTSSISKEDVAPSKSKSPGSPTAPSIPTGGIVNPQPSLHHYQEKTRSAIQSSLVTPTPSYVPQLIILVVLSSCFALVYCIICGAAVCCGVFRACYRMTRPMKNEYQNLLIGDQAQVI